MTQPTSDQTVDPATTSSSGKSGQQEDLDSIVRDLQNRVSNLENSIYNVPLGIIEYNTGAFSTMPIASYFAGQNAVHAYASSGMKIVNSGSGRGWEIQVPITGAYEIEWQQRFDLGGTAGWVHAEALIALNGTSNPGLGYAIESGYATADIYHNLVIHKFVNLNANDCINGVWASSAISSGTLTNYVGLSDTVANDLSVKYFGPTLPAIF